MGALRRSIADRGVVADDLFVERLRVGLWLMLSAFSLFALRDWWLRPVALPPSPCSGPSKSEPSWRCSARCGCVGCSPQRLP